MIDDLLEDNVFCTAIMQILNIPGILDDPGPPFDLDEVRQDFDNNGEHCDEESPKRKPLVNLNLPLKANKLLSKKALKIAKAQRPNHCRFCENNKESSHVFNSHSLRDNAGRLTCPRLRKYSCPICGASGDDAHTVRYCTKKPIYMIKGDQSCEIAKVRLSTVHNKTTIRM